VEHTKKYDWAGFEPTTFKSLDQIGTTGSPRDPGVKNWMKINLTHRNELAGETVGLTNQKDQLM